MATHTGGGVAVEAATLPDGNGMSTPYCYFCNKPMLATSLWCEPVCAPHAERMQAQWEGKKWPGRLFESWAPPRYRKEDPSPFLENPYEMDEGL